MSLIRTPSREAALPTGCRRTSQALVSTKLFQNDQPLNQDLRDLVYAHAVFWKDTPIYATGTANLAAMLLISMPAQEAFLSLVNLVNKSLLKTFYAGSHDDVSGTVSRYDMD